jgi:hypothetical protein
MFRSIFDHPQGDNFFPTLLQLTKDKILWFVVACLLYLMRFVLMLLRALRSLVGAVQYGNNQAREGTQQHQHKTQQV